MLLASFLVSTRESSPITWGHEAPLIQILALLLLTFCILSVGAQFATKLLLRKRLDAGDVVLFVALLLVIGQLSTLLSPEGRIVGNSPIGLQDVEIEGAMKALYGGDILGILTLGVAKISLLVSLRIITPIAWHRATIYAVWIFTIAWVLTGAFSIAFQCPSPKPWDVLDDGCIDIRSVRTYIAIVNILTDVALLIIPTIIIRSVQLTWRKRLTLLSGFWCRVGVIGATVAQLIYIRRLVFDERYLGNVWQVIVCDEVVYTTSIIVTCIPFLKPFLLSLESGFLRADDKVRRTDASLPGSSNHSSGWTSRYVKIRNQRNWGQFVELDTNVSRVSHD
ncbi:hypothetical protein EKO27_g3596 [Xylaria grammica]|uniref:Rhodopsin domain-containing protein n=1 Tax=Xylaria grammica TaxID=363999 RepID=A0A439DAQ8_9PEZI|nr:hypothetical protein EKO27_g3596 [Xylaria grammica]